MTAPPATHKTITVLRTTEHSLGLSPTMRKPAVNGSELTYLVTWCEGGTLVLNFKKTSSNFKSGSPQAMKCQEKVWTVRRCLVSPLSHCNTWNLNKKPEPTETEEAEAEHSFSRNCHHRWQNSVVHTSPNARKCFYLYSVFWHLLVCRFYTSIINACTCFSLLSI